MQLRVNESVPVLKNDDDDGEDGESDGSRMKLREDEWIKVKDVAIVGCFFGGVRKCTPSVRRNVLWKKSFHCWRDEKMGRFCWKLKKEKGGMGIFFI